MSITVKFFARLREELQRDEIQIDADGIVTAADAWRRATGRAQLPAGAFCAVNQLHAKPDQQVRDGDEVAFFPQITGGGK